MGKDLPPEQSEQWKHWFGELALLEEIMIPRRLKETSEKVSSVSLHTFSDALETVYSAAVNSRHEYNDGTVTTRLVTSKARLQQ